MLAGRWATVAFTVIVAQPATAIAEQDLRLWQLCHGGRAASGASVSEQARACSKIIDRNGQISVVGNKRWPKEANAHAQLFLAYRDRGVALLKSKNFVEASHDFANAVDMTSKLPNVVRKFVEFHNLDLDSWKGHALSCYQSGDVDCAISVIDRLATDTRFSESQINAFLELRGDVEVAAGRSASAVASYQAYLEKTIAPEVSLLTSDEAILDPDAKDVKAMRAIKERQLNSILKTKRIIEGKIERAQRSIAVAPVPTPSPSPKSPAIPANPAGPESAGCRLFPNLC